MLLQFKAKQDLSLVFRFVYPVTPHPPCKGMERRGLGNFRFATTKPQPRLPANFSDNIELNLNRVTAAEHEIQNNIQHRRQ